MKRNFLANTLTAGLLACGIYISLNALSYKVHARADFTRGKIYSVSPASAKITQALPETVLLTVYASKELPPQIAVAKDYLINTAREYQTASKGKVRYRLVEVQDGETAREATERGITPVMFDIYSKEKFEQREGFFGLTVQYKDKTERIPFVADIKTLEYDITALINFMVKGTPRRLGFVTAGGGKSFNELPAGLVQNLRTRFEITEEDLANPGKTFPDILVILSPDKKFTDGELSALDNFLAAGGALFTAADNQGIMLKSFLAQPNDTGLNAFLARHGISVEPDMVMDRQSQAIQIARQNGDYAVKNTVDYFPLLNVADLNTDTPPTASLGQLFFPFCAPLNITARDAVSQAVLAKSSRESWVKPTGMPDAKADSGFININPFEPFIKSVPDIYSGPYNLAVFLENKFPASGAATPVSEKAGRIIAVGTGKFIIENIELPDNNYLFFLNCLEWLGQDSEMIAIRSKSASFSPLMELPAGKKAFIKYANVLLPPLCAVLLGLAMWRVNVLRRRKNRALYSENK
ncbi:MAG: GldG family protein [Elusimicrobiaceae bacterium]